jgi:hypothetical protein
MRESIKRAHLPSRIDKEEQIRAEVEPTAVDRVFIRPESLIRVVISLTTVPTIHRPLRAASGLHRLTRLSGGRFFLLGLHSRFVLV